MEVNEKELTALQSLLLFKVIVGLVATMILSGLSPWLFVAGICYCAHLLWKCHNEKHMYM